MVFKTAVRNILRRKGYAAMNIAGLSLGITCCLLLFQYVSYEKSYDAFNENADRIVRLRLDLHDQGKLTMQSAAVYPGVPPLMKLELPEVESYCRLVSTMITLQKGEPVQNNVVLANDAKDIKALDNKGYYADSTFVHLFTLPFLNGDPGSALSGTNKMILSETTAHKYFGDEDAVGKKVTVRQGKLVNYYEVSGVFKDYPANSHLKFNYLISYATFVDLVHNGNPPKYMDPDNSMSWYDFYDYILLKPGTDQKLFNAKLKSFADRHLNSPAGLAQNHRQDLYSLPLRDIHLHSNLNEEAEVNGDAASVSFLFLIAFLIIAISWVNYTNLATARSLERAREVGVRKVLGAMRQHLIQQFLTESFLLNAVALVIALLLALVLTPAFNQLFDRNVSFGIHLPASYWLGFLLLFILGSFASGIYPAFILSSYRPVIVLKGAFKNSFSGVAVRKALIIAQFAISIILIAGTIIVFQQVSYMRHQKIGADISQTVVLNGPGITADSTYMRSYSAFKNDVLQTAGVSSMTASSSIMGHEIYLTSGAYLPGSPNKTALTFYFMYVDEDFFRSYGMEFKAGRSFSKQITTDKKGVVLNEEAVKLFGIAVPSAALNEWINDYSDSLKVIGVVSNYHQLGLNKPIMPIIFKLRPEINNYFSIKLQHADSRAALGSLEKIWNNYFPKNPFSYFFLDESFNAQYKGDDQFGKVFGLFAFIAIMMASFGLLSLSAYNVLQRSKEIGIRKVLGASRQQLLFLLSKDFLVLISISLLVAVPVCWWVMKNWLNDYPFRISIDWWVFIVSALIAFFIAMSTLILQSMKAVSVKPVLQLKET